MDESDIHRVAAFSKDGGGGNPAGVALLESPLGEAEMRRIAAAVGYSETAFALREDDGWAVRYFSPEQEVPFCGHATIGLGAVLGATHGEGVYPLRLSDANITVEAMPDETGAWGAALQSPPTRSEPMPDDLAETLLAAFGWTRDDLDRRIPMSVAHGGANHAVIAVRDRATLQAMRYDFEPMRTLMVARNLVTVALVWAESPVLFHVRNPFAFGGVYEDPATGAAAAAFAGMLRDIDWPGLMVDGPTRLEIIQGEDMGAPSRLVLDVPPGKGVSVRVSGATCPINA